MKKHSFSKYVVAFCIAEITFMQLWSMRIASHNALLVTGLLTANHTVFGGELLLLCLKRILAKDAQGNESNLKEEAYKEGREKNEKSD